MALIGLTSKHNFHFLSNKRVCGSREGLEKKNILCLEGMILFFYKSHENMTVETLTSSSVFPVVVVSKWFLG